MRLLTTTALCCSLLIAVPAAALAASPCDNFLGTTTKQILGIFRDNGKTEAQKRTDLQAIFDRAVDTDWIGRFVLGRFWRTATPAERTQYLAAYKQYVATTYISKFDEEQGDSVQDIALLSQAPKDDGFEAKAVIRIKDEPEVHVDFLLTDAGGNCKVHNITVEGVSLLVSQRSEFQALANSSGVKGLIAAMQKKIQAKQAAQ